MPDRSPASRLADFVPYQLALAANAVGARIAQQYEREFGLKPADWRVMAVLGDGGRLTQRELVRYTLMDKVAVNRAVGALVGRGLAERLPHGDDRRSHRLVLTGEGRAIHDRIMPLAQAIERELLHPFTAAEREQLREFLIRLRASAEVGETLPVVRHE